MDETAALHVLNFYTRLTWDEDTWNGFPKLSATVYGLKLYNPVSGATAWSDSVPLAAYDMLTRPSSRGGLGLDNYGGPVPSLTRALTSTRSVP